MARLVQRAWLCGLIAAAGAFMAAPAAAQAPNPVCFAGGVTTFAAPSRFESIAKGLAAGFPVAASANPVLGACAPFGGGFVNENVNCELTFISSVTRQLTKTSYPTFCACPSGQVLKKGELEARCVCSPLSGRKKYLNTCVAACPPGTEDIGGTCQAAKNAGNRCPSCGNPVNPGTGNKVQTEVLYRSPDLELARTYNHLDYLLTPSGFSWRDSHYRSLSLVGQEVAALRPDGRIFRFSFSGGAWGAAADVSDRLIELRAASGARIGWRYVEAANESEETYDAAGHIVSLSDRHGKTWTYEYSDGTASGPNGAVSRDAAYQPTAQPLAAGQLLRVISPFGRVLAYAYFSSGQIAEVTAPGGEAYRFSYDFRGNWRSVTFPDGRVRSYLYEHPTFLNALTGIVDENGDRFATWSYDGEGRAISSEHAGGAEKVTLSYSGERASVTDALATTRDFAFQTVLGVRKLAAIDGPPCPSCGPAGQGFDANGNPASRTDWNGNRTRYSYDPARNLETQRVEGLAASGEATAQARTITTAWDARFRLPASVAEPLRISTYVYDPDGSLCGARGALCSKTIQATSDPSGSLGLSATAAGMPRIWNYRYDANGSVLSVDGPRSDVADVTTYAYYADDDADPGRRGNVATITNAAGHVTTFAAYNAHGQPLMLVDPNGLTTTFTYDARQRLKARNVGGEITSYDYDGAGQLVRVTLPDGSFLSYSYDAAHRLTGMQDALGNRIQYTLDAMGNRTREEMRDPAGGLAQTRSRVYSSLNRLFRELGAQNQTTEYGYDAQGNVLSVTDPLEHVTTNQYDAFNRLAQVTDPAQGVTRYAYNALDALTQVTDPRGLATRYSVDGLGNLTLQSSPDSGNTTSTYDAAGNLLTQTDANGQTTGYVYDALNRVTRIAFRDGSKQVYAYDEGANGIGRLSSISETDPGGNAIRRIAYAYDRHGRVVAETRTIAGVEYLTRYAYDGAGRLSGMTYPGGRVVTYTLDALGRIVGIDTTHDGQTRTLVAQVQYQPFGGVKSYTLGNGLVYSRSYDQDGRVSSYTLGSKSFAIGYDAASRIEFIADTGAPAHANTYGYDALDRLTSAVTPATAYAYSYDAVGNRLSRSAGAGSDRYSYSSTSNRIGEITPASGPARSVVFDANGAITSDGRNSYRYDSRGRMVEATSIIGSTTYQVNALGQRVRKTDRLGDAVFHYDMRGHLIAESDAGGALKREIFYLGDIPVGVAQ